MFRHFAITVVASIAPIAISAIATGCTVSVNFDDASFLCEASPFECPLGRTCVSGVCEVASDAGPAVDAPVGPLGYTERTLTYLSSFVGVTTDVTVLVLLTPDRVDYEAAGASGDSLEFRDARDRVLPFEVATWDPAGSSQLWLRLFDTSSDEPIVMRYGDTIDGGSQDAAAVWPDHLAVLHFEEDASDSSPAALSPSLEGSAVIGSGYVGNAASLNGIDGHVELGRDIAAFSGKSAATLSTWINYRPIASARGVIEFSNGPGTISRSVMSLSPDQLPRMGVLTEDGDVAGESVLGDPLPGNTWHWLVGTVDLAAGTAELYVDGELESSVELVTSGERFPNSNSAVAVVGRNDSGPDGHLEANLDEVRALSRRLNRTDVAALYRSMTQELFAFGPEVGR